MSSEAVGWAFKQICPSSSIKFTLVALCECANYKTGRIFPSIAHIEEITGQNRKTIITNISELERLGFISDTGERAGTTRQIKVYEASIQTVPKTEQSQKRNSSVFTSKQSQKRDTEPSREPSVVKAKALPTTRAVVPAMPEGVQLNVWNDFLELRKAKRAPLSNTALAAIDREAAQAGWSINDALAECAARGWQSFKADWVKETRNGKATSTSSPDRRSSLARAIDEGLGFLG
ncbi:MAG: helix-turn-helix domain-containing protein [Sphingomonadales bacterium]|nr:helix-turn-helix domain-containing protein [Sphingomonadales bacterium]